MISKGCQYVDNFLTYYNNFKILLYKVQII